MLDTVSLFDAMELDNTQVRIASRRALALAHNRVERNLGRFLRGAQTEDEFLERLALVQDDFAGYVTTASAEVGHEHPEHIAAALKDHYRLAAQPVEFKETPQEEQEEEDEGKVSALSPKKAKKALKKMAKAGRTWSVVSTEHESDKWIQKAIKHPGQLHRDLGVPQGEDIPEGKLQKAEEGDYGEKTKERADLAETLKGMHHGKVAMPLSPGMMDAINQYGGGGVPVGPGASENAQMLQDRLGTGENCPHCGNMMNGGACPGCGYNGQAQGGTAMGTGPGAFTGEGYIPHAASEGKQGSPLWGENSGGQYPIAPGDEHHHTCPNCGSMNHASDPITGHPLCLDCGYSAPPANPYGEEDYSPEQDLGYPSGRMVARTADMYTPDHDEPKVTCPECGGDGKTAGDTKCGKCHGKGKVPNFGSPDTGQYVAKTADNQNNTDLDGPEPKMDKRLWTPSNPGKPEYQDGPRHPTVEKDMTEVIGPMRNDHPLSEIHGQDGFHKDEILPTQDGDKPFADNNMAMAPHTDQWGNDGQVEPVTHQTLEQVQSNTENPLSELLLSEWPADQAVTAAFLKP